MLFQASCRDQRPWTLVAFVLDFLEVPGNIEYRGTDTVGRDGYQLRGHGDDRHETVGQSNCRRSRRRGGRRIGLRLVLLAMKQGAELAGHLPGESARARGGVVVGARLGLLSLAVLAFRAAECK